MAEQIFVNGIPISNNAMAISKLSFCMPSLLAPFISNALDVFFSNNN